MSSQTDITICNVELTLTFLNNLSTNKIVLHMKTFLVAQVLNYWKEEDALISHLLIYHHFGAD